MFSTIEWKNGKVRFIDQRQLPQRLMYIESKDVKTLMSAIKDMRLRGAPALAAAAALGMYLGIKESKAKTFKAFSNELDKIARYVASFRPTARNLFYGIERVCSIAVRNKGESIFTIKRLVLEEAKKIIEEDRLACRKIGYYGARLIKNKDRILTICNAGILATIDYGTALGVIYRAKEEGKSIKVYACETRPMLQGARLTTWELKKKGVDVTLITDNMAATLMAQGQIDRIITGADRIARNGDTANKIGTYNLAVLAHYHKIPFYIAAPISTFDLGVKTGNDIPIEQRDKREVTDLFFKKPIAPKRVKVCNPAFDVTPNELITAIVTEKGIFRQPFSKTLKRLYLWT
ncbi:MAG: S-methyl-5-thioribose-1-phosphate isomerase [Candidatus Omnitrophica bacterium]|nr:S-methyl-5-thioribose-1-phosphate isomerase [Candidatus Omnitrophota bacterium]